MAVGAPSRWWSSALLALLALAWAAPDWSDCPSACQCKWTGGKKSALCRNAGLSAVPNSLNAEMQLIDLSHNNIPYLTKDAFRAVGLINLHKIFARQSGVLEVHRDAFRDLIILIEVDLSDNSISALQPGTFSGNDRLRLLTLSRNPLSELVEAQFPPLPHLRTLDLSGCRISRIHPAALSKLSALETLLLQGNRLQQIDAAAISVAAATLKALTLDGNPWRCDCRLRGFRDWLESRSQLRGSVPPSCEAPESVAGRPWPDVPAEDFACAPEVRVAERMLQAEVGGNVTFWCHVSGDPEPTVRWLVNGRPAGATNASGPEATVHLDEEPDPGGGRWATLSLFNVTEADAGEYACVAVNSRGRAVGNASLLLPQQVVTATTLSKADGWLVWAGVAAGGGVALGGALLAIVCSVCAACRPGRGRRHRHRARHKRRKGGAGGVKGSVSFTDQEKKLLDASITTTERPSCSEGLGGSQPDMELLEQQQMCSPMETVGPPPPPVHITIESHPGLPPPGDPGACGGGAGGGGAYPGALTVFPPPPAEFSTSVLPAGAFGNIFISVSVSQPTEQPEQRYPDLLDIPHRAAAAVHPAIAAAGTHHHAAQGGGAKATSVSVAAGPDAPFYLPRDPPSAAYTYATLPRSRSATTPRKEEASGPPHYDNMGPRVTAGGSSTLSLPDALPPEEDIPPPPLPPMCSPLPAEYVAL